ncbi:MAG: hypothetical protein MUO76_08075, partial [Anaerolineaceae bacterium]|nr:hypothetical protein [Anaerolineaceae bacterium]
NGVQLDAVASPPAADAGNQGRAGSYHWVEHVHAALGVELDELQCQCLGELRRVTQDRFFTPRRVMDEPALLELDPLFPAQVIETILFHRVILPLVMANSEW